MNENIQFLSTTRIAKLHNMKATPDLFDYLIEKQLLIKINKQYQLTKTGVEIGGIYQSNNKNESWVAWKNGCLDKYINDLKILIEKNKKIMNIPILIVDNVEAKYIYEDDNIEYLINIIVCTIKNEQNYYYELNQQIEYNEVLEELVEKIKRKGIINPRYWTRKNIENYNDYYSDHNYDYNDHYYYDNSEEGEVKRMINEVSNTLGYDVDEGLARSFMHDMSK
jgi:hypothetical protein